MPNKRSGAGLIFALVPTIILAFILSGCGAAGNGGLYGGAGGANGTSGSTTAALPGANILSTATATVSGTSETILTDPSGHTLYYNTQDTSTTSACTTGCAPTWPPLLVSSGSPSSSASLSGTLSAQDVGNGMQVLYNGHPLYRYVADTAAGQTSGEGVEGIWHVATPSLAAGSAPATQPTTSPCTGYYCGG